MASIEKGLNCALLSFCRMSESLRSVFAARQLVRKEQLDIEKQLNESRLTMRHRELWHQQSLIFFPDNRAERVTPPIHTHTCNHYLTNI